MIENRIRHEIDGTGRIIGQSVGAIRRYEEYTNIIQIVTPFPINTSVMVGFKLFDSRDRELSLFMLPINSVGNKESTNPKVANWNVWEVEVDEVVSSAIANYQGGRVEIGFTFRERTPSASAINFLGTFGAKKPLPESAENIGDFYICDDYNIFIGEEHYTYKDNAIWDGEKFYKEGNVRKVGATSPVTLPIETSVYSTVPNMPAQDIADIIAELGGAMVDNNVLLRELSKKTLYYVEEMDMEEYENLPLADSNTIYFVTFIDEEGEEQVFMYRGSTLISGGGGVGGPGVEPMPEMRIVPEPLSAPLSFNAVVGQDVEFNFKYTHAEGAAATFNIYRNDSLVSTSSLNVGDHTINLKSLIFNGTNVIRLEVKDYLNQTKRIILNIRGVEITVSSTYQETTINAAEVIFPYQVNSPSDIGGNTKVYFKIDKEEPIVNAVDGSVNKTLSLESGAYILEFWASTELDGVEVESNKLKYMVLVDKGDLIDTLLISKFDIESIQYGQKLEVDYIAYNPSIERIPVEGWLDDVKRIDTTATSGQINTWKIGVLGVGLHKIQLRSGGKFLTFSVNVVESDTDIKTVDDITLKTYLTALGKDNAALDRNVWQNSGTNGQTFSFIMEGFNFASNGWLNDALVFNGRAKATLQYKPFETEIGVSGRTIEIELETPAVHDGTNLIECMAADIGFEIKGNKANLLSSNVRVDANYSENTKVKVSFVISKSKNKVFLYLNGVLTNQADLVSNTRFKQDIPAFIKFNDTLQDLKVYNIRVYDRELEAAEVLGNWIYDEPNIENKFDEYAKSLLFEGNKVSIDKVKKIIPVMTISLPKALPQDPNDRPPTNEIRYEDLFNEELNFVRNNVNIRTQGTSTLVYPVKNYRLYGGELTSNPVVLTEGSRAAQILNLKTDYVDSSVATNAVLAKLFEGMYSKGTRVMEEYPELEARTTIYGSPVALFHNNNGNVTFVGLYSLNNDKSEPAIYGHGIAPYEFSHRFEIAYNVGESAGAFVKPDGISEQDWWTMLKNDFESIYPKDLTTDDNYQALRELVEFISGFDLDNIGSMSQQDIDNYKAEFIERIDLEYITKYFIVASMFGLLDSFGKNVQLNSWRAEGDTGAYKWFFTFYDLDTAIGLDNEGRILDVNGDPIYDYNIELEHGEGFAQANSKLWKVFAVLFAENIRDTYQAMRAAYFTDDKISKSFFDNHIDLIGKTIYNESNFFKYILATGSSLWNYMLNGNREFQIKSWVSNRLKFLDSKYISGTNNFDKMIAFRFKQEVGAPAALEITPYFHQYLTVQFGAVQIESNIVQERADAFEEVTVTSPHVGETPFMEGRVYGADNIAEIKGFADFHVDTLHLEYAENLQALDLSKPAPYPTLEELTLGNNKLLKYINLENLSGLVGNMDFKMLFNLQELNIKGTNLLNIELPNGGALEILHLNDTLTSLSLRNLTYLDTLTLESADDIKELTVENTPVDILDLIDGMPNLTNFRYVVNASTNIKNFLIQLANKIYNAATDEFKLGGIDSSGNLINEARVVGEVRVQVDTDYSVEEYQLFAKAFPQLNIEVTANVNDLEYQKIGGNYEVIGLADGVLNKDIVIPFGMHPLLAAPNTIIYTTDGWEKVIGISEDAFKQTDIESVRLHSEIKYIGNGAFQSCGALEEINLTDSIEVIGNNAFRGSNNLVIDNMPEAITYIGSYAFGGIKTYPNTIVLKKAVIEIGNNAFSGTPTNDNIMFLIGHDTKPSKWHNDWNTLVNSTELWGVQFQIRTYTYNVDGGTPIAAESGFVLLELPIAIKTGYDFKEWQYKGVKVEAPFIPSAEEPSTITLNAIYTPTEYTLTFDNLLGADNTPNPATFNIEQLPLKLESPYTLPTTGYYQDFKEWQKDSVKITHITEIGNQIITAMWEPQEYIIEYFALDSNEEEYLYNNSHKAYYNEDVGLSSFPSNPPDVAEDYVFLGWELADETPFNANYKETRDLSSANWTIKVYATYDKPPTFADATPAYLASEVAAGNYGNFVVGETKFITLTNDDIIELRLVDNTGSIIKREDNTYAGLVIEFRHIYQRAVMNPSLNTNEGGWRDSRMRNITMPAIYELLPPEWKVVIPKAQIQTMDGGKQEGVELVTTLDYLWLPSQVEVSATTTGVALAERNALTRFKFYLENDQNADIIKNFDGSASTWWLRSAHSSNVTTFRDVYLSGGIGNATASTIYGVSPCFVI